MRRPLVLFVCLWLLPAAAQQPRLVLDVDPRSGSPRASAPAGFVKSGSLVFFRAATPATGQELFRTDGTGAGTSLAADTLPGALSGIASTTGSGHAPEPPEEVDLGGALLFTGADPRGGRTLWRAAGASAPAPVADLYPGNDARVRGLTVSGARAFFLAEGPSGTSLFASDGTAAGTRAVTPVTEPGCTEFGTFSLCYPTRMAAAPDGGLFFTRKGAQGDDLYRTSGAPGDVHAVASVAEGQGSIGGLLLAGATLFFSTPSGLWASDGTTAGTRKISSDTPAEQEGTAALGALLVYRRTGDGALWASDGTASGTRTLGVAGVRTVVGTVGARVLALVAAGTSNDLWATDGTAAGTKKLARVSSGIPSGKAIASGGAYLFFDGDPDTGLPAPEIWWSDGTTAGTRLVSRYPGGARDAAALGGRAFFAACDAEHGCEPWVSDGTPAGTHLLVDLDPETASDGAPQSLVDGAGRLFFTATDADHGTEVWTSDGTSGGTHLAKDLSPGTLSTRFLQLVPLGPAAYFLLQGDLWRTDGTAAGTSTLTSGVVGVSEAGGWLWLTRFVDGVTPSLWRTNGSGVSLVRALDSSTVVSPVVAAPGGGYYFFVTRGFTSTLWKTDGSAAGTVPVVPLPGLATQASTHDGLFAFGVWAGTATSAWSLYTSDGTAAGTRPLAADAFDGSPLILPTRHGVIAGDSRSLWLVANGTRTPAGPARAGQLTPSGDLVFFAGWTAESGWEPWRSDGTTGGTKRLADLEPGPLSSDPSGFASLGDGRVVFSALAPDTGRELWISDGSAAGTRLLADVRRGPASGLTGEAIVRSGGSIFFAADDGTTGRELWAFPIPAVACGPEPCHPVDGAGGGPSPIRR